MRNVDALWEMKWGWLEKLRKETESGHLGSADQHTGRGLGAGQPGRGETPHAVFLPSASPQEGGWAFSSYSRVVFFFFFFSIYFY